MFSRFGLKMIAPAWKGNKRPETLLLEQVARVGPQTPRMPGFNRLESPG